MTWGGEDPGSGIMLFGDGDSPGTVPIGTDGQFLSAQSGIPVYVDLNVAISGHDLLSLTHLDTEPASPVDGDLIYASGALWRRLPVGTEYEVLSTNASGFPEWKLSELDVPNASGFNFLDGWHKFSVGPDTTSSTTYVPIDDMTAIPGSGTYAVTFSATISSTKGSSSLAISLFIDEVPASGTERTTDFPSANTAMIAATNGIVSIVDGESISVRWKKTEGPASTVLGMDTRDMMGIRIRRQVDV